MASLNFKPASATLAGIVLGAALLPLSPTNAAAQEDWRKNTPSVLQTDFPYQKACITAPAPAGNTANKGIAMIAGKNAFMCFDTDLLRMSAGWTDGFITADGVTFNGKHGGHPRVAGKQAFGTEALPGWSPAGEPLEDPRTEPYGPIPRSWGRWNGHFVHGEHVLLAYRAGETEILEWPRTTELAEGTRFERVLAMAGVREGGLRLLVAAGNAKELDATQAKLENGLCIRLYNAPKGVRLAREDARVVAVFPAGTPAATLTVALWMDGQGSAKLSEAPVVSDIRKALPDFDRGGKPHWPEAVATQGALNTSRTPDGAYVVDRLTPPKDNPWNRRVRFGGFDFFQNGTSAAVSTWDGDVWIVTGIDDSLKNLQWRRFASGEFETLGLKIVNDQVYTVGRDQITRYHDVNGDGEADFYENFNNDLTSSPGFHEFVFDLHTDPEGNFYFAKAGPVRGGGRGFGGGGGNGEVTAHAGCVIKVSKYGETLERYATGLRAPNGIGVGPDGQVTTGDNEGTYVPACPINWVREGGFYGVVDTAHTVPVPDRDPPLCWLSHSTFDNSGGGQVWVTSDQWGPYAGSLLHMSYGKCTLNLVFRQEVDGIQQGGVIQLPLRFTSSAMRARFNTRDGQLYVAGLRGWQTSAANDAGLDRVRFTGKPVYSLAGLKVDREGVHLTFTQPMDREEATDPESYSVERWNYAMKFGSDKVVEGTLVRGDYNSPNYGGHEVHVGDPSKVGREKMEVREAKLSKDGKTVTLVFEDLQPAMQMQIRYNISSDDGEVLKQELLHTIHRIP